MLVCDHYVIQFLLRFIHGTVLDLGPIGIRNTCDKMSQSLGIWKATVKQARIVACHKYDVTRQPWDREFDLVGAPGVKRRLVDAGNSSLEIQL